MQIAVANLSTALTLNPLNERAYYNRGCLHLVQHQPKAAEVDFDHAIALGATDADTYRDRAFSRYAQGKRRGPKPICCWRPARASMPTITRPITRSPYCC
ncbi:MAG: hypothetical protein HC926_00190 [Synechococcaceae cyanobacterium SM2_3_60]|nr:hypothetical protein [Synechococcaceae cyanobacterium SM2_3_60]